MKTDDTLKTIREEFEKEFAYREDGIYFVADSRTQANTQDIIDFYEPYIRRLLEEQAKEIHSAYVDGLREFTSKVKDIKNSVADKEGKE